MGKLEFSVHLCFQLFPLLVGGELSISVHVTLAISLRSQMLLVQSERGQSRSDPSVPVHATSFTVINSSIPLVSKATLPASALAGLKNKIRFHNNFNFEKSSSNWLCDSEDSLLHLIDWGDSLSIHWRNLTILTMCELRILGKILFVIVLPISGSCQSMVYRSMLILRLKNVF